MCKYILHKLKRFVTVVEKIVNILLTGFKCRSERHNMYFFMLNFKCCGQACSAVVQYMSSTIKRIRDCLDGKNVESVMTELGIRFHRVIYDHLLQFQYNSAGIHLNKITL